MLYTSLPFLLLHNFRVSENTDIDWTCLHSSRELIYFLDLISIRVFWFLPLKILWKSKFWYYYFALLIVEVVIDSECYWQLIIGSSSSTIHHWIGSWLWCNNYRGNDHVNFYVFFAARSESAEFCEYDLDSDDELWLLQFNSERRILPAEK